MNKFLLKILFAAFLPLMTSAQFSAGIFGDIASATISGSAPSGMKFSRVMNFGGGFILDYRLNDEISVGVQPSFVARGTTVAYDLPSYQEPRDSMQLTLSYFSLPLMVKFWANKTVYVAGGAEWAYLSDAEAENVNVAGKVNVKNSINKTDILINFAVGFVFDVSDFNLFFEGRYSQSVTNGHKYPETSESQLPADFKNSSYHLIFGVMYDF